MVVVSILYKTKHFCVTNPWTLLVVLNYTLYSTSIEYIEAKNNFFYLVVIPVIILSQFPFLYSLPRGLGVTTIVISPSAKWSLLASTDECLVYLT